MRASILLALSAAALPTLAYAQSCPSQASMNALASATWAQVMGDDVAECGLNGSGPQQKGLTTGVTCVPITINPGDVTPTNGLTVTDAQGNVWGLYVPPGEDGNGQWYGGITFNGQPVNDGYFIALEEVNGVVKAEEAKGSGWQIADPNNPGDVGNTWTYVADPGPGAGCDSTQAASSDPPPTDGLSADGSPAASVASDPPSDAPTPATTQLCSGTALVGILPGSGSFTDSAGNVYTINPNENVAMISDVPITPNGESNNTEQMTVVSGVVYGEDATTNQWFEMVAGPGGDRPWAWLPVASLPAAGQSPVVVARWDTAQAAETTNLCQSLQAGVTSLPAAQTPQASVTPVNSLGPALSLSLGGITISISGITPQTSIGGSQ
jgi:hypothetical protein